MIKVLVHKEINFILLIISKIRILNSNLISFSAYTHRVIWWGWYASPEKMKNILSKHVFDIQKSYRLKKSNKINWNESLALKWNMFNLKKSTCFFSFFTLFPICISVLIVSLSLICPFTSTCKENHTEKTCQIRHPRFHKIFFFDFILHFIFLLSII